MVKESPLLFGCQKRCRKNYGVKWDIIFSNELKEFNFFRIVPPRFPLIGMGGCNTDIANRSVKPDIEHFIFITLFSDTNSPFKVSSNGSLFQSIPNLRASGLNSIFCPKPLYRGFINPLLQKW